jgi:hypothetical protein
MAEKTIRPFGAWLHEQRDGGLHDEVSEALNALVQAVQATGKGGEVVLKVKVKPAARAHDVVIVSDEVAVKLPQFDREEALFFVDKNANLSRKNPIQPDLPLREVPRPEPVMLREAGDG